ncbi:MAG: hypothetical protein AUJ85_07235 [Elusimicrobia bacterium CG1_02_37_114]|nr:MAG: hypothetical protein AUJ85_07235 [Elusimicrobia bacterium CG1_02_37_114]PIV53097.1 MAG: type II secretion system protein GspE [Elusimicrobia bacterium CG02_land_8_20_14_3_00_37_13]PIZ13198.1 MAG: type II secretion system protein GspE [Elusimicrobia bacterium CG_4_10_14_0_8_um_filter_37_32]
MAIGTRRKTAKDILIESGLIGEEQLNKAIEESKKQQKPLQQAVIDMGMIDRAELLRTLSKAWSVKAVDLGNFEIDPDAAKIVPEKTAKRHTLIPFAKEESSLYVAMADPHDLFVTDDIRLRTGLKVEPYLALPADINDMISKIYVKDAAIDELLPEEEEAAAPVSAGATAAESKELMDELIAGLGKTPTDELQISKGGEAEKVDIMEVDAAAPETEKLVNAILLEALRLNASDIHVEPLEKRMSVRYRVDGIMRKSSFKVPLSFRQAIIAKLKILTGSMNITERRRPQDGRIALFAKGRPIELRCNMIPTVYGESAVMRILDRGSVRVDLEKLTFAPDILKQFKAVIEKPYGLVLVAGPTGSGKSTTLYSALNYLNDPAEKILTAENPVEYNLDGIMQLPVNQEIGVTFPAALRAFLRQDPDIIMVGEIRDQETGQIAMEAAMTGHMVLSTIHTNDSPTAVARLAEMGIHTYLISSTLEAVLSQRLVRRVCEKCKKPDPNQPKELLETLEKNGVDIKSATFMKGEGCPYCLKTGYKGRLGVHEFLLMNEEIRKLILTEIAAAPIRKLAVKTGMRPMMIDGLIKVSQGMTTYEEILAGISSE